MEGKYIYCYTHAVRDDGQPLKWRRVQISEVEEWVKNNKYRSYFSTVQQFATAEKESKELHCCDMYFDFDNEEDVEKSLSDARELCKFFMHGFNVEPKVWFSGNKGFHVVVDRRYFGAEPNESLTYHYHHLSNGIKSRLGLDTLDLRVYSIPRMWRIENTVNHKSKQTHGVMLYKVRLDLTELLNKDIEFIKGLAAEPREWENDEQEIYSIPELAEMYSDAKKEYDKSRQTEYIPPPDIMDIKEMIPCVQQLLDNGLMKLGTKNQADMVLSNYCKDVGMSIESATRFMTEWSRGIPQHLTHIHKEEARVAQTIRVLKTVYGNPNYHFSCGSMRMCGVEVDCSQCKIATVQAKEVELWEYGKVDNMGTRICVEADVIGKDNKELQIPKKIFARCEFDPEKNICNSCTMSDYFNIDAGRCERTIEFTARNPQTIEVADQSAGYLSHQIKRLFGLPHESRCSTFKFDIEWNNAQMVHLANRIKSDFKVEDRISRIQCLHLGHGIDLNKSYKFYGYVYSHPRTRAATFVIDKAEQLQSSLATFNLSQEELDELKIFQPSDSQSVEDKVKHIHRCFINNFVYVFGRNELLLAVDMVFHSVRWVNFQRQKIKGWLDILVLGDTRQGKSDIAKKLMAYYQLGTLAAGETCSRTGLLYTIQMTKSEENWVAFGLLPRANGYLVVVDEIHGMPSQDFKEFTQVRSEGKVDVKRAAYGVASAETRLISVANARPGMSLGSYGYPVQAITDIPAFSSLEDVSRFDYAVGVRAGDVSDDMINRDVNEIEKVDNPYTDRLCRNLILWIWTRTPEQIIIQKDVEAYILHKAKMISKEYIPDIPLVESADVRHKIMRLAVSWAGRTYSSPDGVNLVITCDHVEAACSMINMLYKSPGLDYWGYSDDNAHVMFDNTDLEELRNVFKSQFPDYKKIVSYLLSSVTTNKSLVVTATDLNRDGAERLIGFLLNNRFVSANRYGIRKTPSGREFLVSLLHDGEELKDTPTSILYNEEFEGREYEEEGDEF